MFGPMCRYDDWRDYRWICWKAVELCVSGTPQTNWEGNALYSNAEGMQRVLQKGIGNQGIQYSRIDDIGMYLRNIEKHRNVTFLWLISAFVMKYIYWKIKTYLSPANA